MLTGSIVPRVRCSRGSKIIQVRKHQSLWTSNPGTVEPREQRTCGVKVTILGISNPVENEPCTHRHPVKQYKDEEYRTLEIMNPTKRPIWDSLKFDPTPPYQKEFFVVCLPLLHSLMYRPIILVLSGVSFFVGYFPNTMKLFLMASMTTHLTCFAMTCHDYFQSTVGYVLIQSVKSLINVSKFLLTQLWA